MLRTLLSLAALAALGVAGWHALTRLERLIMTAQDDVLAQIADVKTLLVETGKDVTRVADKLDAAIASGDLTAVSAAVAELKTIAQGIDDRAEASDPELPVEPQPEQPSA
jgi:hypothetical protein